MLQALKTITFLANSGITYKTESNEVLQRDINSILLLGGMFSMNTVCELIAQKTLISCWNVHFDWRRVTDTSCVHSLQDDFMHWLETIQWQCLKNRSCEADCSRMSTYKVLLPHAECPMSPKGLLFLSAPWRFFLQETSLDNRHWLSKT